MSYRIIFSGQAAKELSKLEDELAERVKKKLREIESAVNELGVDPDHYFDWINQYAVHKLRIGDYRLFADVNKGEKRIEILTILKRSIAYKQ